MFIKIAFNYFPFWLINLPYPMTLSYSLIANTLMYIPYDLHLG